MPDTNLNDLAGIDLRGISFARADGWCLGPINLRIPKGETLALMGPTGSGKSTLLRIIAGLEDPSAGDIYMSGKQASQLPPHCRQLSLLMQESSLLPHQTVRENIALPLARSPRSFRDERIRHLAELWDLAPLLDRRPADLSGGERQRARLARALATNPPIVLLDEPWTFLDPPLRRQLRDTYRSNARTQNGSSGQTTLMVTHDPVDAEFLADRIAVMAKGQIVEIGPTAELLRSPTHPVSQAILVSAAQTSEP